MSKQENPFHPDHIDKQIEQLSHEQVPGVPTSSAARLVANLRALQKEDAEIVQRVWESLAERSAEKSRTDAGQSLLPRSAREERQKGPQIMESILTERRPRRRLGRVLEALAAVLIVGALVGSLLAVLHTARQPASGNIGTPLATPGSSHTRLATPTAPADTSGLYLSTNSGIDKISLQSHRLLWHVSLDWASPPIVIGNILIFSHEVSDDSFLEAVNATTGVQLWKKNYGSADTFLQAHGILYSSVCTMASGVCSIDAIRAVDGALLWSYPTSLGSAWLTVQDNVLYGVSYTQVFALNSSTGAPIWQKSVAEPNQEINQTPLVLNQTLYAASCNTTKDTQDDGGCNFLAFATADGSELWHTPVAITRQYISPPAGGNGVVYYAAMNEIYAVNARTGAIVTTDAVCSGSCVVWSLLLVHNTLYVQLESDLSPLLAMKLPLTSAIFWSENLAPTYEEANVLSQGLIYAVAGQNHIDALDPANGNVVKSYTDDSETITGFALVG